MKVEVLDASNNTGALDVYGCRSSWTVLQTLSPDSLYQRFMTGKDEEVRWEAYEERQKVVLILKKQRMP